MIPIYIATRGSEAGCARANRVYEQLKPHGFVWTFNWTIDMLANFAAGRRDVHLTFAEKRDYALKDSKAVIDAHVVIYLEDEKSEGSAGEACWALATHKVVYASCPGTPRCLFVTLADKIFWTDDELVAALVHDYALDVTHSAR